MALTVEEIKIRVTSEDSGLKKLNTEISQLETKIKNLQSAPKGNVSNFKWFKDMEVTLQNAKVAQQQLTQSNSTYSQSLQNVSGNIGGYITNLATVIALQKAWEISLNSAKFDVLRSNFKGLESDLEAFRNATAGSVSDGNLIKLSNQATDLGISLQDQTILMSLAEDAADKYGTGIEEGFTKVINATEGSVKGLKGLGIQKEVYEKIVKDLAKAHGDEIDKLDAETQKEIRIQAIIKASGVTYEQATNKVKDAADEQEALIAIVTNLTDKYGGLVVKGLIPLYNVLLKIPATLKTIGENFDFAVIKAEDLLGSINNLTFGWLGFKKEAETGVTFNIDTSPLEDLQNRVQTITNDIQNKFKSLGMFLPSNAKEPEAMSGTKTKTSSNTGSKNRTKETKEETEALKDLAIEYKKNAMAFIALQNVVDVNTLNALTFSDFPIVLQQRFTEIEGQAQAIKQIFSELATSVVGSMATLFGSFVPEQGEQSAFVQFVKSIATAFISSVQAMILASNAALFAKGITTFGISLISDAPLLAAAWVALEAAKGFIGGFADGGIIKASGNRSSDSGIARVSNGEMIMNARAVQSNYPALQAMNRGGSYGGNDTAIYFSADLAAFTKQTKKSQRDIRQQSKWKRF